MPDDQSKPTTPTFFSDDQNDSGLPDSNTITSTPSETHTSPLAPGHHDIEDQMEKPEPIYAQKHPATPKPPEPKTPPNFSFPPPSFNSLSRSDDGEISSKEEPTVKIEPTPNQDLSNQETLSNLEPKEEAKPARSEFIPLHSTPIKEPSYTPPTPPSHTPASLSDQPHSSGGVATMILALLAIMAITATTFLYLQNKALKQQINILQSTQSGRELPNITPTPTLDLMATGSANPSSEATFSAFTDLDRIISIARQESANAQLLMITSDDITKESATVYKFWFRTSPNQSQYFYIQHAKTGEPQLYTQATISPDNNIPDLISFFQNGTIGIDDKAAHEIAWTEINKDLKYQKPTSVSAKFIRSKSSNPQITDTINLWQLTYTIAGRSNLIVQINSQTKEIVYSNL